MSKIQDSSDEDSSGKDKDLESNQLYQNNTENDLLGGQGLVDEAGRVEDGSVSPPGSLLDEQSKVKFGSVQVTEQSKKKGNSYFTRKM